MGLVDLDNLRRHMVVLSYFRAIELHMGQNCERNQGKYRQIGRTVIFVLTYAKSQLTTIM